MGDMFLLLLLDLILDFATETLAFESIQYAQTLLSTPRRKTFTNDNTYKYWALVLLSTKRIRILKQLSSFAWICLHRNLIISNILAVLALSSANSTRAFCSSIAIYPINLRLQLKR